MSASGDETDISIISVVDEIVAELTGASGLLGSIGVTSPADIATPDSDVTTIVGGIIQV